MYDYVTGIDYRGESINMIEYEDAKEGKRFQFVTNLGITWKNVKGTVERGRWRWKIENEGFNTQKKQGYYLEHRFSHDLSGDEEPLISDTDRPYDRADHRSMGEAVEESKGEQAAKAPAPAECVEKQANKRKWIRIREKNTSKICIPLRKGSDE